MDIIQLKKKITVFEMKFQCCIIDFFYFELINQSVYLFYLSD